MSKKTLSSERTSSRPNELLHEFSRVPEWVLAQTASDGEAARLAGTLGVSPVTARLLLARGVRTAEEARRFLDPAGVQLADPFVLPDMRKAAERVLRAAAEGERILVYGDYDVDGTTSTAILIRVLRALGVEPGYYIPNRLIDGYGLNSDSLVEAARGGYRVVVTVDCGSVAVAEAKLARELGLELIITDHHALAERLPDALAVVNPQRSPQLGLANLSGAGVAFKLGQALVQMAASGPCPEKIRRRVPDAAAALASVRQLAALATVADVVPLLGENRALVAKGLADIRQCAVTGLRALLDEAGVAQDDVTAYHLAFVVGPRINAAGRLGDSETALRLFLTDDRQEAALFARSLEAANRARQEIEAAVFEAATAALATQADLRRDKILVLAGEDWHPGVLGIVASRLVERYARPAILISVEDRVGRGSGRSVRGLHLFDALSQAKDILDRFGGHALAAGLTLPADAIGALRGRMLEVADAALDWDDLRPHVDVDAEVELAQVDPRLVGEIARLAPFGQGNPEPVLLARPVRITNARTIGKDRKHARFEAENPGSGRLLPVVAFRQGGLVEELGRRDRSWEIAFRARENEWNGNTTVELVLVAIKPSPVGERGSEPVSEPEAVQASVSAPALTPAPARADALVAAEATPVALLDRRGLSQPERPTYLAETLVSLPSGTCGVAYVSLPEEARETSAKVAALVSRFLASGDARQAPGSVIAYWDGMAEEEARKVLYAWGSGHASLVVTDDRGVVAWTAKAGRTIAAVFHLAVPLSSAELAAKRDACRGAAATHLLFGRDDIHLARLALDSLAPDAHALRELYRTLRQAQKTGRARTYADLAALANVRLAGGGRELGSATEKTVRRACEIFSELGLGTFASPGEADLPFLLWPNPQKRLDLRNSISYNEGVRQRQAFEAFVEALLGDLDPIRRLLGQPGNGASESAGTTRGG